MECTNISIQKAENGCIVRCEYEEEREVPATRKGEQPYTTKDYKTKTYTAPLDLIEIIIGNVGEEIEEEKPKSKGYVTKISSRLK